MFTQAAGFGYKEMFQSRSSKCGIGATELAGREQLLRRWYDPSPFNLEGQ